MKRQYKWLAGAIACILAGLSPMSVLQIEAADITEAVESQEIVEGTEEIPENTESENKEVFDEVESGEEDSNEQEPEQEVENEPILLTEGLCGEELTWEFKDGTLSIKGKGKMYEYDEKTRPEWEPLAEQIIKLYIEKEIENVDLDAFEGFKELKAIYYGGSEEAWNNLEFVGEKEKEVVFEKVLEYYFDYIESDSNEEGSDQSVVNDKTTEGIETEGTQETIRGDETGLEITLQPTNISARLGETVSLRVETNREDTEFQWQWSRDGKTWKNCSSAGCNTDTFEFVMKEILNGRLYRCIVTAGEETVTSDIAAITYVEDTSITIISQPQDVEAGTGENVSVSVEVDADEAEYQWQWSRDGLVWKNCSSAGYNTDTFSFVMKEALDGRFYRCVITVGEESITSDSAHITLREADPIEIINQPQNVEADPGDTVSVSVEVNKEDAQYRWQWSRDGITWKNCTSAGYNTDTFEFIMKATLDGRMYRCVITSGTASITSDAALITLAAHESFSIIMQPEDVEAKAGDRVNLSIEVDREDVSFRWQWSSDGNTWKNCTSAGYNTDAFSFVMKASLAGRQYRCVVTSGSQSITSETALISLKTDEIIIEGVIYKLIDGNMTVIGYNGNADSVIVQETVDGHTVTVIGESAFEGSSITQIDLPDTIQLIERRAFADCGSLTNMN